METIAKDMEAPISTEFARAVSEINFGSNMDTALNSMVERIQSSDLMLAVSAISVQRQTGGNLSQILETISNTIRERIKVKADVSATTSQGRMSGLLIGALPILLGGAISVINPEYMTPLFTTSAGRIMLIVCIVLECLGFLAIRKIVDIKY
jgi:tight adherence protein B